MSTANPDAELIARGEQFEKLLLEFMDAWLDWAPLMRAARAQVDDDIAVLITAIERTGCDAAQARMSELERDMQPLAEEIIAAPATSLSGLRAKALVALWEALPSHAFHDPRRGCPVSPPMCDAVLAALSHNLGRTCNGCPWRIWAGLAMDVPWRRT
jgi:hypothetical protein